MAKPDVIQGPFSLDGIAGHYRVRCSSCGAVSIADPDQVAGKVSMVCDCGWHETHVLVEANFAV